jgi:hypothetical protein
VLVVTRAEFDALLASAAATITDPAERALVNAEAREFADAVDRDSKHLDYGDAVVLEGANGIVVVSARDYASAPIYWRTVAGDLDRLIEGTELIPMLTAAQGPARTS